VHPEWYSDEFGRLLWRAGLRRITDVHASDEDLQRGRAALAKIHKIAGSAGSAYCCTA
jgi:hypothetical protein